MPITISIKKDENGVPVLDSAKEAIASIESAGSGGYSAIGPKTKSGDRAYGRYQVMGANIPEWTKQALGKPMTPKEFLADPKAQDAVFNTVFGGYIQKYGNPQDAASAWFSGRPRSQAGNSADVTGTTVPDYVSKFNAALGQPTQIGPVSTRFGLPVQKVGDVIPFQRQSLEPYDLATEGAKPYRGGPTPGNFGSKWRDPNYAAQQFGVPVENVKPIEAPTAEVVPMQPKPAQPTISTNPTIQNWMTNPDVVKLRIPQRIANAVQERPELKKMLSEWVSSISSADPSLQGRYVARLSEILNDAGYK